MMESCTPLSIVFLGTGTSGGVPMVCCDCVVCQSSNKKDNRLRSSILIQSKTTTIVVDATPDFRYQMLRCNVRKLDAILITHSHKDHVGGIDDTRAFQYFQKQPTKIYGNAASLQGIKREVPYAFTEQVFPGLPELDLREITIEPFMIGDIHIVPIAVQHSKMVVFGYRFGNFSYITDAKSIADSEMQKIMNCPIVVLNALRQETHPSHFSLSEALDKLKQTHCQTGYLTHISHQMGLHDAVSPQLPPHVFFAYDGLRIQTN